MKTCPTCEGKGTVIQRRRMSSRSTRAQTLQVLRAAETVTPTVSSGLVGRPPAVRCPRTLSQPHAIGSSIPLAEAFSFRFHRVARRSR
jgi:hypothetical protein